MTLAIQRQPRFNKVLLAVGSDRPRRSGSPIGMNRAVESTDTGQPGRSDDSQDAAGSGSGSKSVQDDYLVPQSIINRQAAVEAELRLQDGYLPPTSTAASRQAWMMVQDGYLPPAEQSTMPVRAR